MVALGLVLLVLCLVFGTGLVLSNGDPVSAEAFGVSFADLSVGGLFLLGAAVGALTLLALGLILVGAARKRAKKRALRREVDSVRGEQESLAEENARLQAKLEQERAASTYPDDAGAPAERGTSTGGKHRA